MNDRRKGVVAVLVSAALVLGMAQVSLGAEMSVDEAMKALAKYKFGQSRIALTVISDAVRDSAKVPAQRTKLAASLAAMLAGKEATTDAKRFLCRKLSLIGGPPEVPTLAKLLLDKDLADMARYALERIPDASAVDALHAALGKAEGMTKIGIINSLGERRNAKVTADLIKLAGDKDAGVAEAAVSALGNIGGDDALKALVEARFKASDKAKPAVTNALLACADTMLAKGNQKAAAAVYKKLYAPAEPKRVRIAALQGLVAASAAEAAPLILEILNGKDAAMQAMACGHVRQMPGKDVTKTFAGVLPKLAPPARVLLLDALAVRGDRSAAAAVAEQIKCPDANVRTAALKALATVGDAGCVPILVKCAADKAQRDAALYSLARLGGDGVDAAITKAMMDAKDNAVRAELIKSLAARDAKSATPCLLKAAASPDGTVRGEAGKALGQLGGEKDLPPMVQLLVQSTSDADRDTLGKSIAAVARRVKDERKRTAAIEAAMKGGDAKTKAALLSVLGRVGGAGALGHLKAAVKDSDATVQEAAVRAMQNWPDTSVAAELLSVAKAKGEDKLGILAFRGYVAVARKETDAGKALKLLADGMKAAPRLDEKKLVLGGMASVRSPAAVKALTAYLDDDQLKRDAVAGIFGLVASDRRIKRSKEVKAAKQKILTVFKDDKKIVNQAKKL